MTESPTVLAIGAHAADFAWRCGGALAHYAAAGSRVVILALTFGERGESDAIWQARPGVTADEVKLIRRAEAERAAEALGAEISFLDFDDFPLLLGPDRDLVLLRQVRAVRPRLVLTHCPSDPLNTDHPTVSAAVTRLLRLATVPGVLLSGHHAKIAAWRREEQLKAAWERRPDLLSRAPLTPDDRKVLARLQASTSRADVGSNDPEKGTK